MQPKVSIIVPVYNVEKYLPDCLDSLVNQDYSNIEIFLIDDKSTDNSLAICKEYAKKNKKIIILQNKKNEGASSARNKGLRAASGEYIGFVDADDYIQNNYYSELVKNLQGNKADIAVCDIVITSKYTRERIPCGKVKGTKLDFINNGLAASSCNKLFKKELFKNIFYEEGKTNEDIAVIIPLLVKAKNIAYNDKVYYEYNQRENSIQNSSLSDKKLDIFHAVEKTIEEIDDCKNYNDIRDSLIFNQIILFILYVPEKELSFVKRYLFLRKIQKYSKHYTLTQNNNFINFLNNNRKIYRLYYSSLVFLTTHHMAFLANLVISLKLLYNKKNKKVIPANITIDSLVELAKNQQNKEPLEKEVSVVIPNYNYERFLYERVYSILHQEYKINEIIFLDDVSKDRSRNTIDELEDKLKKYIPIKKIYNKENVGTFSQWEKGINQAKSSYVWIAEADDYCDSSFLSNIMQKFIDPDVVLSYCDTAFINAKGEIILKSVKKQIDIQNTGHFNKDYICDGKDEFNNYTFLNCTIANVSSTVIKKGNYQKEFVEAKKYHQVGDWVFYSLLMQKGKIGYSPKTYNYYRLHQNNVSTTMKKEKHFAEIKNVHDFFDKKFKLNSNQKKLIKARYKFLKDAWQLEEKR